MAGEHNTFRAAWDRQWRANILSTLAGNLDPDAARAIEQGWIAFFERLPQGASILDLGTGNGYLTLVALADSDSSGKGFDIHGCDYAAIDPPSAVPDRRDQLSRITFHPNVSCESLTFAGATFDAVVSQHAIEYAGHAAALREAARVLKPGGVVRFLLHAREGAIVKANLSKIKQCEYVLEKAKLFEITEQAVSDALQDRGDGGAALKKALSETAETFKGDANTADLMTLLNLLWGAYQRRKHFPDVAAFRAWLAENRAETEAQLQRIRAMEKAALTEKEAEAFAGLMEGHGFENVKLGHALAGASSALIGWQIEGSRRA